MTLRLSNVDKSPVGPPYIALRPSRLTGDLWRRHYIFHTPPFVLPSLSVHGRVCVWDSAIVILFFLFNVLLSFCVLGGKRPPFQYSAVWGNNLRQRRQKERENVYRSYLWKSDSTKTIQLRMYVIIFRLTACPESIGTVPIWIGCLILATRLHQLHVLLLWVECTAHFMHPFVCSNIHMCIRIRKYLLIYIKNI